MILHTTANIQCWHHWTLTNLELGIKTEKQILIQVVFFPNLSNTSQYTWNGIFNSKQNIYGHIYTNVTILSCLIAIYTNTTVYYIEI